MRAQDSQLAEYIKEGIKSSRSLIRSGAFSAKGIRVDADGSVSKLTVFHAFDSQLLMSRTDKSSFSESGEVIVALGQCIQTRKNWILLSPDDTTISIVPLNKPIPNWAKTFDFRAFGLAYLGDITSEKDFHDIWEIYENLPITSVVEIEQGKYEVIWNKNRKMTVDEEKGFWPVEFVKTSKSSTQRSQIELTLLNETWVPYKYRVEQLVGDSVNSVEIELDWTSVNEKLDETYFDYSTFKSAKGMKVVDFSIPGKPVTIEIIGKDVDTQVGESKTLLTWPYLLFGLATLVVSLGAVGMFLRRQSSSGG